MPTYVTLYTYTGAIKGGGPDRFEKVKQIAAEEKGKILSVYGLLGAYDVLAVGEFPDNEAAMKAVARIGNLIGAKSNTMAALDRDAFIKLLGEL